MPHPSQWLRSSGASDHAGRFPLERSTYEYQRAQTGVTFENPSDLVLQLPLTEQVLLAGVKNRPVQDALCASLPWGSRGKRRGFAGSRRASEAAV